MSYALFARREFAEAARAEAGPVGAWLVDAAALDAELAHALRTTHL